MSSAGAAPPAAVLVKSARAEASRKNGAESRGPKTPEGKARSSQKALKHGMRAEKHVVLPDEDAAEFAALQAAMMEELAPVGVLQTVLARRVAVAAWRLVRADRGAVKWPRGGGTNTDSNSKRDRHRGTGNSGRWGHMVWVFGRVRLQTITARSKLDVIERRDSLERWDGMDVHTDLERRFK